MALSSSRLQGRTGTVSDSPAARQVACPHSCEARVKGTALSAAAALLGKGRTPCGVLVKRWSNHNLFSLGPNWSPDGLISRVRHYSLSSPGPSRLFSSPGPFKSCKISIWKSWEARPLECEDAKEMKITFRDEAKEMSSRYFCYFFIFWGRQKEEGVLFGLIL